MNLLLPVSIHSFAKFRPAARPSPGKPLTVGLLHNCKPNADTIILAAYEALAKMGLAARSVFRVKHQAGQPMDPEILSELQQCNLVINGLAN